METMTEEEAFALEEYYTNNPLPNNTQNTGRDCQRTGTGTNSRLNVEVTQGHQIISLC